MKKIEKVFIPIVLIASIGMCALWIHEQRSSQTLARELSDKEVELEKVEAARKGLLQANDLLQARINSVEKAAAELKSAPRRLVQQNPEDEEIPGVFVEPDVAAEEGAESLEPTILSPAELAEKQKRDEERAAQQAEREQQRKEFQERVMVDLQTRREFFSQINTDGLAPEYQEAHQKLMLTLEQTELLMAEMSDPDLSRDERRELGRAMWQQAREMGGLMDMQRDVLLNDYAELSLGLTREQTREFMNYMETVNQMTSGSPMRGGGRGR